MPKTKGFDWSALTETEHRKVLQIFANDGHTIYSPAYLLSHDCPQSVIDYFGTTHSSDRADPKNTITVNDRIVDSLVGVYGLTVLHSLANHYHISTDKSGRGFQAQDLTHKLYDRLDHVII